MGSEHPDWLPVGWKVSVKIRSCGRKDKYYVNPSNGLKFNSKPEVLRYLKTSGIDRKPKDPSKDYLSNSKNIPYISPCAFSKCGTHLKCGGPAENSRNKGIDIKKTVAEKLPPGWIKEIRTKKKGGKTRRDPYYIDPVTGRYFRSMQEVFRYLESNESRKADSKADEKARISVDLGDHSQSSSPEAKRRRSIDKKADKNLPTNGIVKSGSELGAGLKCAAMNNVNMPEDNHLEQTEDDDSLAIELSDKLQLVNTKKQHVDRMREMKKSTENKVDKSADEDQRLKSGSKVATGEKVDTREANVVEQRERENDSVTKNLPDKLREVNGKEEHKYRRRQSKRLADIKPNDHVTKDQCLQSGSEVALAKNSNISETNSLEQREKDNNSVGKGPQDENVAQRNKRKERTSDLPRRTSKRLARVEVNPSLEDKTNDKDGAEVNTTKSIGKAVPIDEPNIDNTGESGSFNGPNKHLVECRAENPATTKPKQPVAHESLSSLKEHKDEEHEKLPDSSLKDLLMDPCIEFAIKTLTGAIPIDDVNKVGDSPVSSLASPNQTSASSSMLPSNDIWTDPCFEFAVKTLTGDMTMENGTQLQISFQKPLGSPGPTGCNGLMLPKIRLDNIYPSDCSFSQFDSVKKPCLRQEAVRDPPFPHGMNGGSKNFHHSVEGQKGNFL